MILNCIYVLVLVLVLVLVFLKSIKKEHFEKNISKKQLLFKTTLEEMASILEKNKIPFFLYCGTALGAHREKKFIEHDKDIDLGIFENNNMIDIMDIITKSNKFKIYKYYPLSKHPSNNITEVSYIHKETNVKIDIFKVFKYNNNKYIHYSYTDICNNKTNKRCEFINPIILEPIMFFNKKYMTVNKEFLISHYGKDWTIPHNYTYSEGLKKKHYKSMIN